ncbi:hypothetical protein KUF71_025082, partial [Frankliniella fusca]
MVATERTETSSLAYHTIPHAVPRFPSGPTSARCLPAGRRLGWHQGTPRPHASPRLTGGTRASASPARAMASVEEMVVQPTVLARITGRTSPTQLGHVQLPGRQRTRSRRALPQVTRRLARAPAQAAPRSAHARLSSCGQDRRAWPVSPQKKQAPRRAASQRSRRGVRERALERTLQLVGARRREVLPLQVLLVLGVR